MTETKIETGTVNLLVDVITKDRELPEGYDGWAIRTVRPDFTSQHGYKYPFPGNVAVAPGPILSGSSECPSGVGDGICAAKTWEGMASGGVVARTLLLVAYKTTDALGESSQKLRLREFLVVDLIDGEKLLKDSGSGAYLSGAYLSGADLSRANLSGADLSGADLSRAYLSGAYLSGAYLSRADLSRAYLSRAYLSRANLSRANLSGAYLSGADLSGANYLTQAQLNSAYVDKWTELPSGLITPKVA